jgi:hypothetical protein
MRLKMEGAAVIAATEALDENSRRCTGIFIAHSATSSEQRLLGISWTR